MFEIVSPTASQAGPLVALPDPLSFGVRFEETLLNQAPASPNRVAPNSLKAWAALPRETLVSVNGRFGVGIAPGGPQRTLGLSPLPIGWLAWLASPPPSALRRKP